MIKQFNYKQFGNIDLAVYNDTTKSINTIEDHIKIIFIPQSYGIKIDFQEFILPHDALLFVNPKVFRNTSVIINAITFLLVFNFSIITV